MKLEVELVGDEVGRLVTELDLRLRDCGSSFDGGARHLPMGSAKVLNKLFVQLMGRDHDIYAEMVARDG